MTLTPTDEQLAALMAFRTGENIVIEAGAGTGKTSTLQLLAQDNPNRRGLYVAFNKAIQMEAERKFAGTSVMSRTVHSLAYRDFGSPFRERMNQKYMFWTDKASILGITERYDLGASANQRFVTRQTIVRLATETVARFCKTPDSFITANLVQLPDGLTVDDDVAAEFRQFIAGFAQKYWEDTLVVSGKLPYVHDYYLKTWMLSNPVLNADFIMLDEAQDSDPVMISVLQSQGDKQLTVVGDPNQAIYGWRGAKDSMNAFGGTRTQLTQSFRFGVAIAEEANYWLELLDSDLRLKGLATAESSVWKSERRPEAVLTRTNAGAIREVLESQKEGVRVGIAGSTKAKELKALAKAALELQEKGKTNHRELDIFNSWDDVVLFSQLDEGSEIAALVKVVEDYTAEKVIHAIDACVDVEVAEQVISTAHVAKGLEWFHVRIAGDFRSPGTDDDGNCKPIEAAEARLNYVAVTRAQRHLDASGLDWAKTWPAGVRSDKVLATV